jgi:hypothetical protein
MAPRSAPMASRTPSAIPAFAPPDMPLLLAASDEELADGEAEPVAAARPPIVLDAAAIVLESGSNVDAVAMLALVAELFGVDVGLADSSSSASLCLADEDCSLVAGARSVFCGSSAVVGALVGRGGGSTAVGRACVCVIHTTSPVKVFGMVTTTVSISSSNSSSSLRPRWRRTRCDNPCWCTMMVVVAVNATVVT